MTPKPTYSPAGLLLAALLLVAALCGGGALVSACDPYLPAPDADMAAPDGGAYDASAVFTPPGGGQGSLPIGYFERQCQWDACGGPKDRLNPLVNPLQ